MELAGYAKRTVKAYSSMLYRIDTGQLPSMLNGELTGGTVEGRAAVPVGGADVDHIEELVSGMVITEVDQILLAVARRVVSMLSGGQSVLDLETKSGD